MSIWIGNIILLIFYGVIVSSKTELSKGRKTSLLLIIMFLQLLFLYVFNDSATFPDKTAYLQGFDYSLQVGWNDVAKIQNFSPEIKFELGWCYYTKILSFLYSDSAILIFATGFIIIISYFILIKKYSLIPWLSILLFITTVFYNSLFVLRQYLAVAICLFSIPYIIERKFWKFLLLIIIAFSIHQTAVIFVLLYLLYPFKIEKKFIILVISMGILFYVGFEFALNFAATHLIGYLIYKEDIFEGANNTLFILSLCVFVFIWICYYPLVQIDNHDKLFFYMLLLFVMIEFSRIGLPGTIGRLNLYFYPALIILLPNACKRIKKPIFKYISITSISVVYFIFMIRQMNYGFHLIF